MSEARLIEAAAVIARTLDDDETSQLRALADLGFDEGQCHRLIALLPMAFSRPVLEELGVDHFVLDVGASEKDGTWFKADLMRQPEYVEGLRLARKHRRKGVMNDEVFSRIAGSSADIDVASKALNEGKEIAGATIASALSGAEIGRHLIR